LVGASSTSAGTCQCLSNYYGAQCAFFGASLPSSNFTPALIDIDNDDLLDMAVSSSGLISIHNQESPRVFSSTPLQQLDLVDAPYGVYGLGSGDLDGNGANDILVAGPNGVQASPNQVLSNNTCQTSTTFTHQRQLDFPISRRF
jgi:hypothetical protein